MNMTELIKTVGLMKSYRGKTVLDNINLTIKKGKIYGFIGKNGAGKTTLIKILSGLAPPTQGEIYFNGSNEAKDIDSYRKKMSFMVETPYLHLNITAYENLNHQRLQKGLSDKSIITEVLKIVGLKDVDKKMVLHFSLGMKQRLGIAISLLSQPEFLVLDEPVNGLDPQGIKDIRNLLLRLNAEKNITIFICSHLLEELSLIATDYVFIHSGKILQQLTSEELNDECRSYIKLNALDVDSASLVLENLYGYKSFEVVNDAIHVYSKEIEIHNLVKALVQNHIEIFHVEETHIKVEDYFLRLIGENDDEKHYESNVISHL